MELPSFAWSQLPSQTFLFSKLELGPAIWLSIGQRIAKETMCTYILKDMNIESYALFCIPAGLNAKKKKETKYDGT